MRAAAAAPVTAWSMPTASRPALTAPVGVLLGPQIEERGGIGDAANASRAGPLRGNQPFRLETNEHAVRQADRDAGFAGQVLDLPFAGRLEEQRLRSDPGLAREPGVCLRARCAGPSTTLGFGVEDEARELDVGVAEPVDDGDAVSLEDLARIRRRRPRDEQEVAVGGGPGLLHDLPGGGRVGPPLDLHRHGFGGRAEPEHGIASTAAAGGVGLLDGDSGDVT